MRVRAPRPLETSLRAIPGRNVAEIFFAGGGLCEMTLTDEQQTALVRAVAKHLLALRGIPDLLPHLHVDVDAVEVRPSSVCDGLGVFATRKIRSHELVTLSRLERGVAVRGPRWRRACKGLATSDVRTFGSE